MFAIKPFHLHQSDARCRGKKNQSILCRKQESNGHRARSGSTAKSASHKAASDALV